jgi:hypothetical protein
MSVPRVRLYVKSVKTVIGNIEVDLGYEEVEGAYTGQVLGEQGESPGSRFRPSRPPNVRTGPKEEYVLPEDQERTSEMVKHIASRHGLEVEVVDVARENILHRVIQEEREKIEAFSALLADSGERIEGDITEEQAESFLSRIADGARKKYL